MCRIGFRGVGKKYKEVKDGKWDWKELEQAATLIGNRFISLNNLFILISNEHFL